MSPATLDLLAKSAASLGSMRDAQGALADQGINVSVTRISTAVRSVALAARTLRTNDISLRTLEIKGRKVIASIDGGRLRIRQDKKGKKTKKGRTRYKTDWREPKLLCIYFLDENGNVDRTIPPILDGTMGNADKIFKRLCEYLLMLGIDAETEVLFVADGATWIWDRVHLVEKIVKDKGGRFRCLLDYYPILSQRRGDDSRNCGKDATDCQAREASGGTVQIATGTVTAGTVTAGTAATGRAAIGT